MAILISGFCHITSDNTEPTSLFGSSGLDLLYLSGLMDAETTHILKRGTLTCGGGYAVDGGAEGPNTKWKSNGKLAAVGSCCHSRVEEQREEGLPGRSWKQWDCLVRRNKLWRSHNQREKGENYPSLFLPLSTLLSFPLAEPQVNVDEGRDWELDLGCRQKREGAEQVWAY